MLCFESFAKLLEIPNSLSHLEFNTACFSFFQNMIRSNVVSSCCQSHTPLGVALHKVEMTDSNMSEILRLFVKARGGLSEEVS